VVSDQPVSVKMLQGFLNAQRLDIDENGSVLRFSGVTMTLEPGKESTNKPVDAAGDSAVNAQTNKTDTQ
jgi:lipopolysaccharide export system protein LptC